MLWNGQTPKTSIHTRWAVSAMRLLNLKKRKPVTLKTTLYDPYAGPARRTVWIFGHGESRNEYVVEEIEHNDQDVPFVKFVGEEYATTLLSDFHKYVEEGSVTLVGMMVQESVWATTRGPHLD